MEIFLAFFLALICVAFMILIKLLDYKIDKIGSLIDNLNEWVCFHNKLTKRILKDLENFYATERKVTEHDDAK